MLDGFKRHQGRSAREEADHLEALIATSREERAALTVMLSQVQLHVAKLTATTRTLQEDVEALEMRLRTLSDQVAAAEKPLESRLQTPNDDTLRTRVEAVTVQVSDARRKLESVSAIQAKLLPLTAQLTSLKSQIEKGEVRPPRLSF